MIFKAVRHLIYSPLVLIVDGEEIDNVEVNDPAIDIYDYYEVIGIRSWTSTENDGAVVISLKPTITSYYEDIVSKKVNNSYESGFTCKK